MCRHTSDRLFVYDARFVPRWSIGRNAPDAADVQAEKDEPQPQVLFTFGFWNLKPAPWMLST